MEAETTQRGDADEQAMPRASDVDGDLSNGEHVEIKSVQVPSFASKALMWRLNETKPSQAPKKIVIPAVISAFLVRGEVIRR